MNWFTGKGDLVKPLKWFIFLKDRMMVELCYSGDARGIVKTVNNGDILAGLSCSLPPLDYLALASYSC